MFLKTPYPSGRTAESSSRGNSGSGPYPGLPSPGGAPGSTPTGPSSGLTGTGPLAGTGTLKSSSAGGSQPWGQRRLQDPPPPPLRAQPVPPPVRPVAPPAAPPAKLDLSALVVGEFKKLVLARGGTHGIHTLARIYRIMDSNNSDSVTLEELTHGLQRYGLHMDKGDVGLLFQAIDRDHRGSLSFDEFISAVRGPVNERRKALIDQAFAVLDKNGNGTVEADDVAKAFDVSHHPEVLAGRMDPRQARQDFLSQFDGIDHDGRVSREEFLEYYGNISGSIGDDDYFELMIRNAWHMPGGKGWYENTANRRLLVTFTDGTQRVVMLESDLGMDVRNQAVVKRQLEKQGLPNVRTYQLSS